MNKKSSQRHHSLPSRQLFNTRVKTVITYIAGRHAPNIEYSIKHYTVIFRNSSNVPAYKLHSPRHSSASTPKQRTPSLQPKQMRPSPKPLSFLLRTPKSQPDVTNALPNVRSDTTMTGGSCEGRLYLTKLIAWLGLGFLALRVYKRRGGEFNSLHQKNPISIFRNLTQNKNSIPDKLGTKRSITPSPHTRD